MIDAEPGIVEHAERDRDERGEQHLARGADVIAEQHHHRERDREVIGIALLEAERAWLEAEAVLEQPGAENGCRASNGDRNRRRGHRPCPDHAHAYVAHASAPTAKCIPLDLSTISARSFPRKRESKARVLRPRFVALGPR